jgi:hypothetical protein
MQWLFSLRMSNAHSRISATSPRAHEQPSECPTQAMACSASGPRIRCQCWRHRLARGSMARPESTVRRRVRRGNGCSLAGAGHQDGALKDGRRVPYSDLCMSPLLAFNPCKNQLPCATSPHQAGI